MYEDCVFCQIIARAEPAAFVRTNQHVVAFLTMQPATRGHTLVIPRRHARNIFDIERVELEAVARTAQEIALWQRERLGCSGVSLYQANEPAGFQTVFHYHVHVVPRYPGDDVRRAWTGGHYASSDDLEPVARELRGGVDLADLSESTGVPTHGLGAASVITDGSGRVLLVRHTYGRRNWEIPGGISEEGESAEETARREAREEIGSDLEIEALTGVYWEPSWAGIGGHHFAFRARLAPGSVAVRTDAAEVDELGWFHAEQLPRPISDFTVRRIRDALAGGPALVKLISRREWLE